jgi:hypothetical protein
MKLVRFVFPFLFVRNWHDGLWELSRARAIIFGAVVVLVILSVLIAYMLQTPVVYTKTV